MERLREACATRFVTIRKEPRKSGEVMNEGFPSK